MATEAAGAPCAFCRQEVGAPAAHSCPRCAALYHPDCWQSNNGRCAVYACEPAVPAARQGSPAPRGWPVEEAAAAAPRMPRTLWVLLFLVALSLLRILTTHRQSSPEAPWRAAPAPALDLDLNGFTMPPAAPEENVEALYVRAENLIASAQPLFSSLAATTDLPRIRSDREALRERALAATTDLEEARHLLYRCRASRRGAEAVALAAETTEALRKLRRLARTLQASD